MLTFYLFFKIFFLCFLFGVKGFNFDPNESQAIQKRTLPLDLHTTCSWSYEKSLGISPFFFFLTRYLSPISNHKKHNIINTLFGCQKYQTSNTHQKSNESMNVETNTLKKTSFILKSRILESVPLSSHHKTSPHLIITLHKIGAIVSLFLVGVVGGYLPYCFQHKKNFHTVMMFVNSFSTGAFFGLMFFHLSPEIAYISKNSYFGFNIKNQFYDLTFFSTFWGFFSVFLLEKIVAPAILAKTKQPQFLTHCHSIAPPIFDEENSTFKEKEKCHQTSQNGATPQHSFESPINRKEYNTQSKICISHTHDGIIFDDTPSTIVTNIPTRHSHKSNVSSTNSSTHILSPSFFVIFLVCFALCFHSVTEGIVIGLLSDSMSIWIATLSVCGHKCVASFSLAANCLQNQVKKNISILFLIIFSLSSPFGVLIGLLSYMPDSKIFIFINCVSLGAIMYAACDMAFSEFHHFTKLKTELKKVACLLFGASIILLLTLLHYATGSHNHQHHS